MSFCSLPLELRHAIYSYVVFDASEPCSPPPLIQIVRPRTNSPLSHRHCKLHASPKEIYEHFAHNMIDPVQTYGSMFMEFGTNRPYLSTPRPRKYEERTLDISDECGCKTPGNPQALGLHGLSRILSLLLTNRQFADETRAWLYPKLVFDFSPRETEAFETFAENLLPGTKRLIYAIRLSKPIYSYHALEIAHDPPTARPISRCSGDIQFQTGFNWRATTQSNLKDIFPNLRALHVNLWHFSRRLCGGPRGNCSSGLAAPIGDMVWRKQALEPLLRFADLPLEEVTVVVDNVWPLEEIWSGDPTMKDRRELADWLRTQLMTTEGGPNRRPEQKNLISKS